MSDFSKLLEVGIMKSGMTEKQLSKISGFTRSYIALMKNGQRVSPDVDKMIKLVQALNLSPNEYDSLWEEYIRARMGKTVYERNLAVLDFINSFNENSNIQVKAFYQHDIPELKILSSHMDIEYMLRAIIENESMKENGFVHIIMQGGDNILPKILPNICRNNPNLKVEHIVCMEKYAGADMEDNQLYNVKMLKELVPIMIFSESNNYKVYYYYDYIAARSHAGMLLPYMILTSECVICVDANFEWGMISKEAEILRLYAQIFQKQKKNCRPMFRYTTSVSDIMAYYPEKEEWEHRTYSLSSQPCFGVLKIIGMLKRYCRPEYESCIPLLEEKIKKNEQWIADEMNHHISYCNKSGLLRFVTDGIVDELPREIYEPISLKDRKRILQMLLERIEDGSYELYFLEDAVNIPRELIITAFSMQNVLLMYMAEHSRSRVVLQESSMTRLLYEAMQYLMRNPQVSAKEEAEEYIKGLIERIKL